MDLLLETATFAAKGLVVFLTIAASAVVLFGLGRRRNLGGARLVVKQLNERFEALSDGLAARVLGKKAFKKQHKATHAARASKDHTRPSVFVLDFKGDLLANDVKSLREEVTAIVGAARPDDEVVVRLESPGGAVPHYGLAAAQLARLRSRKVKLTVCIDRVAASGGYLMACVADRIVAAPFSIIGSIGVVAQVPNLHRLLKKHDVDFEEMTAGEFKRTVTVFGEITPKGKEKFQDQLEDTHALFKEFVKAQRPALNVDQVATGEHWLGTRALSLGLVDQLGTSDEYLLERAAGARLFEVRFEPAGTWRDRVGRFAAEAVDRTVVALLTRALSLGRSS